MSEFALSIKNTARDLEVQKYPPILTPEQEYELAIELYENESLTAAKKLVLAHMRFVAFIAHGYKGYGLEQADLIQEGTIGLMKAVKRFNPHKKVRLSSFAVYWIRAEIHEYIFKNWKIVKVATTKAQRKLFLLNPMHSFVSLYREIVLLGQVTFIHLEIIIPVSIITYFFGGWLFMKIKQAFGDVL